MSSRRIFRDIEEAISREVRRITHHENRTVDQVVLKDVYDPFDGSIIQVPVEPRFYDSSADAHNIGFPHFFIRLLKAREDKESGRIVPPYGKQIKSAVVNAPKAYEIIVSGADGSIPTPGNTLNTGIFQIRKVQPGYLLRLTSGNNKGTYIIDSVTTSNLGNHEITVSDSITLPLPSFSFDSDSRTITFDEGVDLNTILVGDIFEDASSNTFPITALDAENGQIVIGGSGEPDSSEGSTISRTGNVFQNADLSTIRFMVMNPDNPIVISTICGETEGTSETQGISSPIPIDAYYLVRIDSKSRDTHIDVLNRVWEEFNPPKTALPIIARSALSADKALTLDIPTGGSTQLQVEDNSDFNIGDTVFLIDDLTPTKRTDGEGFQRPFTSKIKAKPSSTIIELEDTIPDTFVIAKSARIVSNAEFRLFMFHFVDHNTKDVEGAQYWVHEFTFIVQLWVDRLEEPETSSGIQDISTQLENLEGDVIIEDP